jgi:cyclic beta-1,2-glucan synthetase
MKPDNALPRIGTPEQNALSLAQSDGHGPPPPDPWDILTNIHQMPVWLEKTRLYCREPYGDHTNAADWLLDNDYQVTRAIRQVLHDMPDTFYRRLNVVKADGEPSLPRIFLVAHAILEVANLKLNIAVLAEFLKAYQGSQALTTAELWALPSMLRLAALEVLGDAFAELNADLVLGLGGKRLHDALHGLYRTRRVHGREHQVPGLRGSDRQGDRFQVA